MRQVHRAGEKLFVDFSGRRPHLVDARTGEERAVELFVGVLGASGLIYAAATPGQDLPSWIGAHVGMLEYFQGSAAIWVPDNLKSGVTTANRYEPEINRTYAELARHYAAVVIPARVARPQDKPQVEVSVQIAQRWVLAALRHRTFFTLADLNAAIRDRVDAINDRPMKLTGVSRRALFQQIDRPALKPLPRTRYDKRSYCGPEVPFAEWHDSLQALGLGGPHKPLGKRVQIWAPGRQDQWLHATVPQQAPKVGGVERVSVQDEVLNAAQEAVATRRSGSVSPASSRPRATDA
jgi:hypothetical protein